MTDTSMTRDDAVASYRAARHVIRQHLSVAIKRTSPQTIKDVARKLGLLSGRVIGTDCSSEMALVCDLIVFGARADRSRATDRYARASRSRVGSIEATVLAALQACPFHIVQVKTRHHPAGIVIFNVFRQNEFWLMDEGLEATLKDGLVLATRLVYLDPFYSTVGASVPMGRGVLQDAFFTLAARNQTFGPTTLDDARLPKAIYAAAIRAGAMRSIVFDNE